MDLNSEQTAPPTTSLPVAAPRRQAMLRQAQRLAALTVGWNVIEGAIAITAAWMAGSRALLGFGLDSAIESVSATVLLWRLAAERRDPERAERVEHTAVRAIGASFLLLAAFVAFDALRALVIHDGPEASLVGIVLTLVSLVVMPVLAHRKRRVAVALSSRTAQADSAQTWACAWLSGLCRRPDAQRRFRLVVGRPHRRPRCGRVPGARRPRGTHLGTRRQLLLTRQFANRSSE